MGKNHGPNSTNCDPDGRENGTDKANESKTQSSCFDASSFPSLSHMDFILK